MKIRTWLVIALALAFYAMNASGQPPSGPDSYPVPGSGDTFAPNVTVPGIGVDYFVYDTGTYDPESPTSWPDNDVYVPGHNFKTPIGLYQLNPGMVNQQLADMRASGMDWITIQIQIINMHCETDGSGSCNDGFVDGIWGEVNDYAHYYALWPQTQQNLRDLLTQVRALGFRYVVVRFMNYSPGVNGTFDETNYQKAWNMIVKTRSLVYSELSGGMTQPLFDLDGEGPGSPSAVRKQYDQRLWSDYTYTYGNDDTVGFSVIADDYHLTNGLPWFGSIKPKIYAFDIYGDVGAGLLKAWHALGAEQGKPILIMETYYNDAQTASQIKSTLDAHPGIHLLGILQWETNREVPCDGCSTVIRASVLRALNTVGQVANYTPVLSKFASASSDPTAISAHDVNCSSTTDAVCEVGLTMNRTDGAAAYEVYVRNPGGTPKLWTCQGLDNHTGNVGWIKRNTTYQFTYFRVSACGDSVDNANPDAEVTLSVRY